MTTNAKVITIDGPAASGKTSVSREVATRLGYAWVSTGAFYRGLAYAAKNLNIEIADETKIAEICISDYWRVEMTPSKTRVIFQDNDVTDLIGAEEIGSLASKISGLPKVRANLLQGQRNCRHNVNGLIAEGRDCGTVVFPDADLKFYLTARADSRAERRALEQGTAKQEIAEAQKVRDLQDSQRKTAPMQIPSGAIVIDTSELNFEEVVNRVLSEVKKK